MRPESVVKTGAMTFLEAALEILRHEGKPLHYKELTEHALGKKLLTFVGRTPEVTMQTQLTAAVKKAPGNPFVRVKPGIFGLLQVSRGDGRGARGVREGGRAGGGGNGAAETRPTRGRGRDGRGGTAGTAAAGRAAETAAAARAPAARPWARRRGREQAERRRRAAAGGRAAGGSAAGRGGRGAGESEDTMAKQTSRCTRGCRPRRAPRHWLKPACSKARRRDDRG